MIACAAVGSFHSAGFSARSFSSSSRAVATSQSKMPPQQRHGLPDLLVEGVGFDGHAWVLRKAWRAGVGARWLLKSEAIPR
jgi:hypothetical protein